MKDKIGRGSSEQLDIDNNPNWDDFVAVHPFGWLCAACFREPT